MDRLIVICDGGLHTFEYILKHKIYPGIVIFDINKFQEIVPYLNKEDEILLIIKGLTEFTMSDVYALMHKLKENEEKIKNITILSNIKLGVIPYRYYLYEGDLFFGNVKLIDGKQEYNLDKEGNIEDSKRRFKRNEPKLGFNPIAHKFRKYNDRNIKAVLYGGKKEEIVIKEDDYEKNIIVVDFYN